jgi:hypothetical protein
VNFLARLHAPASTREKNSESATFPDSLRTAIAPNVEASRSFAEGLAILRVLTARAVRDHLEKAIAFDRTHVLAHSALLAALSPPGHDVKAVE